MNLGQNKFYVGFGAFMLISTGVLGWFLFQASSDFGEAETRYQDQVTQLQALQTLPLYPEKANLQILEDQKGLAQEAVISLHKSLLPHAFPLEPMTPEQFQDKLNESVKAIEEKASKAGVQFAEKFYLGFAQYRATTPKPEAAAVLGRQLKCIELVVNTLIEEKVVSIGEIVREPLLEEGLSSKSPAQSTPAPAPKGKKGAESEEPLVSKYPFKITFVSDQLPLRKTLNTLSKSDQQFFIIRPILIKNEVDKSPKRVDPEAAAQVAAASTPEAAGAPAGAAPSATPKPEPMKYVLGAEKINVTLRLDSVFFASNLPK